MTTTLGLPLSSVVNVTYNFASAYALAQNTNSLLILGDSNVVGQGLYTSASAVAGDYGLTSPEYLAANLYFSYNPQPQSVQIARWYHAASAAYLQGGILTPSQQVLTNFTTITNGGVNFVINGTAQNLTGLNFDAVTNLNGVASALSTALSGYATVTWNGSNFVVTTTQTGAGTAASGTATFSANPAANDTLTINGVAITFVSSAPTGNQVLIGTNAAATIANLLAFLIASTNASLIVLSYSATGTVLTITDRTVGTAGNSIALTKSSTAITVSGSTLAGGVQAATIGYATTGAGEDISSLLGLTSTTAQAPVAGYAAETAVAAVQRIDATGQYFFGLTVASPDIVDADHVAIAAYIEATSHVYFVSTSNTNNLVAGTGIGSTLAAAGYKRTCVTYNGSTPYAGAGLAAIPLTVNYAQSNSANTIMFKQLPGVTADTLTPAQAAAATANRVNYFVNYQTGGGLVPIVQNGVMSGPAYIDEIVGITAIIFDMQAAEFNLLLIQPKVDQTDDGMALITAVDEAVLDKYVAANFLAPGVWNGQPFGIITTGETLPKGYYCYRAPIATQAIGNRAARQAIPGQHALKLAGAVQSSSVLLNVNR